jgi:LysM repeat protein
MKKHRIEDLLIILVIIGLIYGIYSIFSDDEKSIESNIVYNTSNIQVNEKIEENNSNVKKEENQSIIKAIIEKHTPKHENNLSADETFVEEKNLQEIPQEINTSEQIVTNDKQEQIKSIDKNQTTQILYRVQNGDSLGRIGKKFGVDFKSIKNYNKLTSEIVYVGQLLTIPIHENSFEVSKANEIKTNLHNFYKEIQNDILEQIASKTQNNQQFSSKTGFANIRLTILKNGNYEQLILQDGDKEFYELIKEDIQAIFPIRINEEIMDKFPRYFRMKIEY